MWTPIAYYIVVRVSHYLHGPPGPWELHVTWELFTGQLTVLGMCVCVHACVRGGYRNFDGGGTVWVLRLINMGLGRNSQGGRFPAIRGACARSVPTRGIWEHAPSGNILDFRSSEIVSDAFSEHRPRNMHPACPAFEVYMLASVAP